MYKRILVPVDGSSTSTKALVAALQLARDVGAQVRVLHALDELAYLASSEFSGAVFDIARENAQKVLQDAAAAAESVASTSRRAGPPSRSVVYRSSRSPVVSRTPSTLTVGSTGFPGGDPAESAGVDSDRKLVDQPGQRLGHTVRDEAIAWKADLIVVGTHGRRGIERVLLGSGAEQVIRAAPVPVLVVRADEATEKD